MRPRGFLSAFRLVIPKWVLLLAFLVGACGFPTADSGLNTPPNSPLTSPTASSSISESRPELIDRLRLQHLTRNPDIHFEHLSVEDGLSNSTIFTILQDRYGFLWFGTPIGLNRFNGYEFEIFQHDPDDPNSISHDTVYSLVEDSQGSLWVGTYGGGLNRYNRRLGQFEHFRHDPDDPTSLSHDLVYNLYLDRNDNLWIATLGGGLNRYDRQNEKFIHYKHDASNPHSLPDDQVVSIAEDSLGNLWVGTNDGLAKLDPKTQTFTVYRHDPDDPQSLSNNRVFAIFEDSQENLWIGTTGGGLNRFDRQSGTFTHYQHDPVDPYSLSNDDVYCILEDKWGGLWIGTMGGGLNQFERERERFIHYRHDPGIPTSISNDYINVLFQDVEDTIWIGTASQLDKFVPSKEKFIHYYHNPEGVSRLSGNMIFSIFEDRDQVMWIGSDQGLNRIDYRTDLKLLYTHDMNNPDSLAEDWVNAIYEDSYGMLWLGTNGGGIDRYDYKENRFIHHQHDPQDPEGWHKNHINTIYEDSTRTVWFGTESGLVKYDRQNDRFPRYYIYDDYVSLITRNDINAIYEDRLGQFWIGTWGEGLWLFDREHETFQEVPLDRTGSGGKSIQYVTSIYEDAKGMLWFGSNGNGLARYDPESQEFTYFGQEDGLTSNRIAAILEDYDGKLWVSTDNGLSRIASEGEVIANFFAEDGLQGDQFYSAAYRRKNGELWFGGSNGITIFHPSQIVDNQYKPPVVLSSLRQDGEAIQDLPSLETLQDITLSWPNNEFEFEITALSYVQPDKNRYAYKLDGYDRDWNEIGTRRFGKYTNLPGGTYTLQFKGSNNDIVWNETGTAIRFNVIPPFWETWWFQGMVTLLVVASAITGYTLRMRNVQARNIELENQVAERTSEIKRRQQELEALYKADQEMHRYLNLNEVLQALVDVSVNILKADKSAVFLWDEDQKNLYMQVSRGFSEGIMKTLRFRRGEGITSWVAETGQKAIVEDALYDSRRVDESPEAVEAVLAEGIRSFMHLPICLEEGLNGVFNVSFTKPHAFGSDEVRLFSALAQRAALSIENAKLYEKAQELAVVQERSRLARDLHDSAKQKAFAALAQLGAARGLARQNSTAVDTHLQEAEGLVYDVIQELVILIQELYPAALKERGLVAAIREHVYDWSNHNDIHIDLKIDPIQSLPLKVEQALYRVTQEALANISRHSGAHHVELILMDNPHQVELCITDDGQGFSLQDVNQGLGLRSMRERAQMIHGQLNIHTSPDGGTEIELIIPH